MSIITIVEQTKKTRKKVLKELRAARSFATFSYIQKLEGYRDALTDVLQVLNNKKPLSSHSEYWK